MSKHLNVNFRAKRSEYGNCSCDACFKVDFVTKIALPKTLFYDCKNLTTKYRDYWLCDECAAKLAQAIKEPAPADTGTGEK